MNCTQNHRYVIETDQGISEIFRDPAEGRQLISELPSPTSKALWVAFHEVPIDRLVENPHDILTYCAAETNRVETYRGGLDFAKRS